MKNEPLLESERTDRNQSVSTDEPILTIKEEKKKTTKQREDHETFWRNVAERKNRPHTEFGDKRSHRFGAVVAAVVAVAVVFFSLNLFDKLFVARHASTRQKVEKQLLHPLVGGKVGRMNLSPFPQKIQTAQPHWNHLLFRSQSFSLFQEKTVKHEKTEE